MTLKNKAIFNSLSAKMQTALLPFVEEHQSLTKGEKIEFKFTVNYDSEGLYPNHLPLKYKIFLNWDDDDKCSINDNYGSCICYDLNVIKNSPEYRRFNDRIKKFIRGVNQAGKKEFGDKEALWRAYFSKANY